MDLVEEANKILKKLKLEGEITKSTRKGKKLQLNRVLRPPIHFGSNKSTTFLEGADEQKRKAYRARASKIKNKKGEYTYDIPYTPNYLAYNILW